MIDVKELEAATAAIAREHGDNTNVIIQLFDDAGQLIHGDYCLSLWKNKNGQLILTNK